MSQFNLKALILAGVLLASPFAHATLEDGIRAANEGEFAVALKEFQYLADKGFAPGIYELAKLYEGGYGVTRDYRKAAALYQQGVKKNHADSMFALAVLYDEGKGVKLDHQMAVTLFEKAAKKNLPAAQFNLGVMYANGVGVTRDYEAARNWYEKAAANNYSLAQFNLALMYFEGLGMQKILKSHIFGILSLSTTVICKRVIAVNLMSVKCCLKKLKKLKKKPMPFMQKYKWVPMLAKVAYFKVLF